MKKISHTIILLPILLYGCTSVTTKGQALIAGGASDTVFDRVLQAVVETDLEVINTDKNTGLIAAKKATASHDVNLNITLFVRDVPAGIAVEITSTLGNPVGFGLTRKVIEELHQRLAVHLPEASFTIDGKPYQP